MHNGYPVLTWVGDRDTCVSKNVQSCEPEGWNFIVVKFCANIDRDLQHFPCVKGRQPLDHQGKLQKTTCFVLSGAHGKNCLK